MALRKRKPEEAEENGFGKKCPADAAQEDLHAGSQKACPFAGLISVLLF